jgi:non-homologous end joining protein Ku
MAAREIWKGSIYFGVVNILVQVFSTTQKGRVEIHDENVVICKTVPGFCFNMEVWLAI